MPLSKNFTIGQKITVNGMKFTVFSVTDLGVYLHIDDQQNSKASEIVGEYWQQFFAPDKDVSNAQDKASQWINSSVLQKNKEK